MTDQDLTLEEAKDKPTDEKLQKVLARAGVGSRREIGFHNTLEGNGKLSYLVAPRHLHHCFRVWIATPDDQQRLAGVDGLRSACN